MGYWEGPYKSHCAYCILVLFRVTMYLIHHHVSFQWLNQSTQPYPSTLQRSQLLCMYRHISRHAWLLLICWPSVPLTVNLSSSYIGQRMLLLMMWSASKIRSVGFIACSCTHTHTHTHTHTNKQHTHTHKQHTHLKCNPISADLVL